MPSKTPRELIEIECLNGGRTIEKTLSDLASYYPKRLSVEEVEIVIYEYMNTHGYNYLGIGARKDLATAICKAQEGE